VEASETHPLELNGKLLFEPEVVETTPGRERTFVFLDTGDEGSVPQEVLCEGQAGVAAAELSRGDRVTLRCAIDGPLWRCDEIESHPVQVSLL
jgi:hypothetical protein